MAGILIIGFYCFFWWLCWKVSNASLKAKPKWLRVVVFFVVAATPYYYYLYEKSGYDEACDSVKVYFPKEKIDFPESFVTDYAFTENTVRSFSVQFDYLIAPVNRIEVQFDKGISQFQGYAVYPLEGKSLPSSEDDKKRIKENVRFGYFNEGESFNNRVSINTKFIYDFKERKRISSYSRVSYSRGLHTLAFWAFPVDFKHCEYQNDNFKDFDFKTKTFFKRTFKNINKRN